MITAKYISYSHFLKKWMIFDQTWLVLKFWGCINSTNLNFNIFIHHDIAGYLTDSTYYWVEFLLKSSNAWSLSLILSNELILPPESSANIDILRIAKESFRGGNSSSLDPDCCCDLGRLVCTLSCSKENGLNILSVARKQQKYKICYH